MNWSSLLIFFIIGAVGLWVAYSFLNKNGLFLFAVVAPVLFASVYPASMFNKTLNPCLVIMPIVFLALIACNQKYGKQDAIKLFVVSVIAQICAFLICILQAAYMDALINFGAYMTWDFVGSYFAYIVAFVAASFALLLSTEFIKLDKLNSFLQNSIYIAIASTAYNFVFIILSLSGIISFGNILLTWLVSLILVIVVSFALGFFERFLNRQIAFKMTKNEAKQKENKVEKTSTQEVNEENKNTEESKPEEENINYENSAE